MCSRSLRKKSLLYIYIYRGTYKRTEGAERNPGRVSWRRENTERKVSHSNGVRPGLVDTIANGALIAGGGRGDAGAASVAHCSLCQR